MHWAKHLYTRRYSKSDPSLKIRPYFTLLLTAKNIDNKKAKKKMKKAKKKKKKKKKEKKRKSLLREFEFSTKCTVNPGKSSSTGNGKGKVGD